MHVYIIRHGETDFNRNNIVQGSGIDSDLNDTGRAQALAFYEAYRHINFELVVTSRLKRTHQTVDHFIQQNIPWHQTEDLNEISWGDLEGTPASEERHAAFNEIVGAWRAGQIDVAFPGGESARQLEERLTRFLSWLRLREEKNILVATHGRTLRALITQLKALPVSDMDRVGHVNTSCYLAHFTPQGVEFKLENDLNHLKLAGLLTP
ncbi:MAG: histidine phosphatase family protein [Saprospiraceae bacterium]|nr:histidine phosphatase family protein [Saprospiraceae bacterium]